MKSLLELYVFNLVKQFGLDDIKDLSRDSKMEILRLMQRNDNDYNIQDAIRHFLVITRKNDDEKSDLVMKLLEDLICNAKEDVFDELVDLLQDEIIDYYRAHLQCMIYEMMDRLYPDKPDLFYDMPRNEREDYKLSFFGFYGEAA